MEDDVVSFGNTWGKSFNMHLYHKFKCDTQTEDNLNNGVANNREFLGGASRKPQNAGWAWERIGSMKDSGQESRSWGY